MGYSPDQVDRMSLWELAACIDGHNRANGAEEDVDPPSYEDHLKMVRLATAQQTPH